MKICLLILLCSISGYLAGQPVCASVEEKKLYDFIMSYRKSKRLKPIPYSEKMTRVAQTHVRDLVEHFDYENRGDCNPHSWSDKGSWTPCCYTPDHRQAKCMWNKPKEISGYEGEGYEIAFYSSDHAEALEALEGWKGSTGHNPLLVNSGTWSTLEWKAIGVGIYGQYAVVWFGILEDPSTLVVCK
ncbi:MAG: hypothetical protein JNL40_12910 [Cyclobacteriaceae bacterium]|nr:hypothetical protein [Cyclobacteriaceae bacterium]